MIRIDGSGMPMWSKSYVGDDEDELVGVVTMPGRGGGVRPHPDHEPSTTTAFDDLWLRADEHRRDGPFRRRQRLRHRQRRGPMEPDNDPRAAPVGSGERGDNGDRHARRRGRRRRHHLDPRRLTPNCPSEPARSGRRDRRCANDLGGNVPNGVWAGIVSDSGRFPPRYESRPDRRDLGSRRATPSTPFQRNAAVQIATSAASSAGGPVRGDRTSGKYCPLVPPNSRPGRSGAEGFARLAGLAESCGVVSGGVPAPSNGPGTRSPAMAAGSRSSAGTITTFGRPPLPMASMSVTCIRWSHGGKHASARMPTTSGGRPGELVHVRL